MLRRSVMGWTVTAAMLLSLLTAPRAAADADAALELISSDAEAALIVPSLAALNRQVAELRLALNLPFEEMDDVVGQLRHQLGMVEGVEEAGPVVLSMFDMGVAMEGGTRPGIAMLVPVSDYQAFVNNFDGDTAGGITTLTMVGGQTTFARQMDNFAVLSDRRDLAEGYTADGDAAALRDKLGSMGRKYLDEASVAFYLDIEAVGSAALRTLERAQAEFQEFEGMMFEAGLDADTLEATQAMQQLYLDAGRALVEGGRSMLIAFDLTDQGLGMTQTFQMRDGSPLQNVFRGTESDAATELAYLPDRPFLFASAVDDRAMGFSHMIRAILDTVPEDQLAMFGPMDQTIALLDQTQAYATAFYVPSQAAMMSGGFLNMLSTYRVDDPQAYLEAWRNAIEQMDDQQVDLPEGPEGPGGTMRFSGSYVADALQIDGVQVAQYQVEFEVPAELAQQMDNPFAAGFGSMSYGGYIAGKGDHVLMTTTTDPQVMRAALRALDQPAGLGAAGPIAAIREHAMPPNAAAESYVSLQGMAQLGNLALMMFGGDPIEIPDDVPPIAMGAGVQDDGVAMRLFIPTGAMKAVSDVVEQAAPMLGGFGITPEPGPGRRPPY